MTARLITRTWLSCSECGMFIALFKGAVKESDPRIAVWYKEHALTCKGEAGTARKSLNGNVYLPVGDLELSRRTEKRLKNAGVELVAELTELSAGGMFEVVGYSRDSLREVELALNRRGFALKPEAEFDPAVERRLTETLRRKESGIGHRLRGLIRALGLGGAR